MSVVVVADSDLRERMRCLGLVAANASGSAVGAANWSELVELLRESEVKLVLYADSFEDAPEDALVQVRSGTTRLVVAANGQTEVPEGVDVVRTSWPMDREELVGEVRSVNGPPSSGARTKYAPVDFLQMLCTSGDSSVLVLSRDDDDVGVVEVRDGQLWTAFDRLGVGDEAFSRLIHPSHRVRVSPVLATNLSQSIERSFQELVLESLSRLDEGKVSSSPSVPTAQLEAAMTNGVELWAEVKRLNDEARSLLMFRNYEEAAKVLNDLSDLDPESPLVRANLEQLRRLGFAE